MKGRHYLDEDVEAEHRKLMAEREDLNGTDVIRYSTEHSSNRQ